ncbi:MAG: hypothetical protein LBI69_03100 [Puniceicoccales bacterium]|jgi:hypothetical protein|nr:hypothetical protein [Puniceicoccales bacterium]
MDDSGAGSGNIGGGNIQGLISSLAKTATAGEDKKIEDYSAFVPNAASLVASAGKSQAADRRHEWKTFGGSHSVDFNLEKRKMGNALIHAQRINPNGSAKPYLDFSAAVQGRLLEDLENLPDDAKESAEEHPAEGEAEREEQPESPKPFDRQIINEKAYSPQSQKVLKLLTQYAEKTAGTEIKTISELYNFAKFSLSVAKDNVATYESQKKAADAYLAKLRMRRDPKSMEKLRQKEELLKAIDGDLKEAQAVCSHLTAFTDEMDQRDGQRIRDGFNITPKAFKVIEEAEKETPGTSDQLTATGLAANYIENILQITNASQFYEDYVKNYSNIDFKTYINLAFNLLGDDIKSINPTRGNAYLEAIRNELFCVTTCHQIHQSIIEADYKLQRIYQLREQDEGTFTPSYLCMKYNENNSIDLSLVKSGEEEKSLGNIELETSGDVFAEITEQFYLNNPSEFILFSDGNADAVKMRNFKNKLIVRYGCRVLPSKPQTKENAIDEGLNSTARKDGQ